MNKCQHRPAAGHRRARRLGPAPRQPRTYAADDKLPVCAPLHDAISAAAPAEKEKEAGDSLRSCMRRASITVTSTDTSVGVEVPVEVNVIRYPDGYVPDKKPETIEKWKVMLNALEKIEAN